jgi:serine protease Do
VAVDFCACSGPSRAALRVGRRLLITYLTALAAGACCLPQGRSALAAEVDAVGVAAPTSFADIIERVRPAVVGVRAKVDVQGRQPGEAQQASPFPPGSPLDRFLRQFGITPDNPGPKSGVSVGAGFLISGDGYVVTNNHVIAGGRTVEVTMDDGTLLPARVIGTDPPTDLALIKISSEADLPYVRLAKTEPRIGEWVLPIGNPFGLGGTVTAGIVSARGRDIGEGPYDDFIQIDAPVNEGNSGGPTFNVRGEVVGVNTAIYSSSGGSVGVAFDIPAETVRSIVEQLKDKGRITRGWIGVEMQAVTPTVAEALGLKKAQGALVAKVEPDGPAARQGIKVGDVITSIDDHEVKDTRDLAKKIAGLAPETPTSFGVFRKGQQKFVTVQLGELPSTSEAKAIDLTEDQTLGLTLAPGHALSAALEKGVVVMDISPEGAAADSGLQAGDVILSVSDQPVDTPADVSRIVSEARAHWKRAILVRFRRDEMLGFAAIPIG